MNNLTIIGNLGKDPELRYSQSGKAVAKFSVATTKGRDENKKVTWHNVVCFEEQAEQVCEALRKGMRVVVVGEMSVNKYTDKDGIERLGFEIVANEIGASLRFAPRSSTAPARPTTTATYHDEDPF